MNEIICPNCDKAFKVDEAGFADIVKQVRDHQFEEELANRLDLAKKDKENAVKLAEANIKNSLQKELAEKEIELSEMEAKKKSAETEKESAIKLAVANIQNTLQEELAKKDKQLSELKSKSESALAEQLANKEAEIAEMKSKIQISEAEKKLEISEATKELEKVRDKLIHDLEIEERKKAIRKND